MSALERNRNTSANGNDWNAVLRSKGTITLKKGEGRYLKSGGAWIFDNEIAAAEDPENSFSDGDIVRVHDFDGFFLGFGFYNSASKIRIRMLSRWRKEELDETFIRQRVRDAWQYRKDVMYAPEDLSSCRLIFGEADFLPGLTVDKYEDILVVQSLALGIDRVKDLILDELVKVLEEDGFPVRGIYERSDASVRRKEGMPLRKGWILGPGRSDFGPVLSENPGHRSTENSGEEKDSRIISKEESSPGAISTEGNDLRVISTEENSPGAISTEETGRRSGTKVVITENGIRYRVDFENGQKTGFFLDQKYNRQAIRRLCTGRRVLDCFTHMGTFALNAGAAGAAEVTGLDISEYAIEQARENVRLNHLEDRVSFRQADVLEELPKLVKAGDLYDIVILDPPAFTKSRNATKKAVRGYREINLRGLKLVKNGGYLATCSCSHFMTRELFEKMMREAARDAHKRLRQVEFRTQAPDHPILWTNGEDTSSYLKFYIFQVTNEY